MTLKDIISKELDRNSEYHLGELVEEYQDMQQKMKYFNSVERSKFIRLWSSWIMEFAHASGYLRKMDVSYDHFEKEPEDRYGRDDLKVKLSAMRISYHMKDMDDTEIKKYLSSY